MFGHSLKYSPVATNDEEKRNTDSSSFKKSGDTVQNFWSFYNICLHIITLLLFGILAIQWLHRDSQKRPQLLASELPFAKEQIGYVDTIFQPSGFTDSQEAPSAYFGSPTPEKDQLWAALYDVGMAVITKEEYRQLSVETTHLVGDSESYLVTIEMFHQLHCLDYIRHVSYAYTSGQKTHHADESDSVKAMHVDHCIDYLRQVIQCHGDLTPITLETIPGVPVLPPPNPAPYKPDFSIKHTCRSFDQIYNFALQRNTSGYKVA